VSDWLHGLSVVWLAVVVFAFIFAIGALISMLATRLAAERGLVLNAVSPGLLPPMALVFGLLVGFLAAQVWSDGATARAAVSREASALRAAVLLSAAFPGRDESTMRALVRRQIEESVHREWPQMARQRATIAAVPAPLTAALHLALALQARKPGQVIAQREIVSSLQDALDARRQRILISESSVNSAKWLAVLALGILTLIAIACVHSADPLATAVGVGLFAAAIGVSIMVIAAQDRPFDGPFRISPSALRQVEPRPVR
jgi:Protein of unknown function (DUF4239)